jgi:hypothetical protein
MAAGCSWHATVWPNRKARRTPLKTKRARSYFGNDGCWVDDESDVQMSWKERKLVMKYKGDGEGMLNLAEAGAAKLRPLREHRSQFRRLEYVVDLGNNVVHGVRR